MNKIILIGRLTRDTELKYAQSREPLAVVNFTIAVNRKYKREGEPDADFINCVAFGKNGEFINKYFKKAMKIAIVGRISTNNYTDKDGNKRTSTEVIVEESDFVESKASFETSNSSNNNDFTNGDINNQQGEYYSVEQSTDDDNLPF